MVYKGDSVIFHMNTLTYICNNTTIRQLMQAGIVPEWMYEDCDVHGMDTAEDFLCEWDWEWDWDLGKGYSNERLDILAKARDVVRKGIEVFESTPELQKIERERLDKIRKKKELKEAFRRKFCPPFYAGEIDRIVDHVVEHDEEPFFSIFYCWFVRHRHCDHNRTRFVMAGVYDGITRTPKEIEEMVKTGELQEKFGIETEFTARQIQRLIKTPCDIKGKLDYIIPAIKTKLELYRQNNQASDTESPAVSIISEHSPLWAEIQEREPFDFKPELMSRALSYFLK